MSRNIDERIVEMKFDNKQFEGGIKESLTSLSKLEEVLNKNISSNSIDNISRSASKVDLSGLIKGVESISDRFSTMGIVGMRIIENITDGLINGLGRAINSVTDSIVSGGIKRAMNIENAHFQLQGIIGDEAEVQKVMKQANESVDGTAYAYDSAAKAASMFAATGLKSGESMEKALKGIAGVAATTNSDYESMARIFTTVAGNGRIMGDQLLQLSTRGMNAAAALKDFFNGVLNGSIAASKGVDAAIRSILGASDAAGQSASARQEALQKEYEAASKQFDKEYNLKKKTLDKEYKALQNSLNAEYNLKKKTFDKEYKALSDTLDEEIKAQQKANNERIKAAEKAYREDVSNYQRATQEKISLIDQEYSESLKLIDKEAYARTKAIDDQIDAINKLADEEAKAKRKAEREQKLAELQKAVNIALTTEARQRAEEELAAYQKQINEEDLAESRKAQIEKLRVEKEKIQEEAALEKEAAKEKRDDAVESINEESSETLNAMGEKYNAEREALQEALQAQIDQMRDSKSVRLEALKESQAAELETFKNGQNNQLEILKENQESQLSALKEANQDKLSAMKDSLKDAGDAVGKFSDLTEVTEADIREMVSKGLISFDIFSEAMATTFGDHAKDANKTFVGSLANVGSALARTGALFITPLISQDGEFVRFFNAIRVKINEFNAALGASNGIASQFTNWIKSLVGKLAEFIEGIKLANTWTQKIGDGTTRVYESATKAMEVLGDGTEKVVNEKIYTPFHALQSIVRIVANMFMGLLDVVKPIGAAFKDVFLTTTNSENFYEFIDHVKKLSDYFRLSDEQSKKLKTAFTGIFRIVQSVIGVFARLLGITYDNTDKSKTFVDILLDLIETVGEIAIKISDWIDNSVVLNTIIETIGKAIGGLISIINGSDVELWNKFVNTFKELTGIDFNDVAESIKNTASEIGNFLCVGFVDGIDFSSIVQAAVDLGNKFLNAIKELFGIHSPSTVMRDEVGSNIVQGLINGITDGFSSVTETAVGLLDAFWNGLSNSTDGSEVANDLTEDQEKINPVLDWIKNTLIPTLTDNLGGVIALAGSGGLLYVLLQLGKSIRSVTNAVNVLGTVRSVALSYSKSLRADAFKKIAEGIAIGIAAITVSLLLLSKADPKGLARATYALGVIGVALVSVTVGLLSGLEKMISVEKLMGLAATGFAKAAKNLTASFKINAIAALIKSFAETISIIIVDIAAIMLLYNLDKDGFYKALEVVGIMSAAIITAVLALVALGEKLKEGTRSFARVTGGILALSLAVLVCVTALKDILKLDINIQRDWQKLTVLAGLFVAVAALAVTIGAASRIAGKGGLKTGPLLAMCLMIVSAVYALKQVMALKLGRDWTVKLAIFYSIFESLGALMVIIGVASRLAKDGLKGAGTILSVCAFIVVAIGAIGILSVFPAEAFKKGAVSLGIILLMLAAYMAFAAKSFDESSGKTVLGMAAMVATIVASIAFLSFIEFNKLLPAAISLGGVLIALSLVFSAVSKITNEGMWKVVLSMVAILAGVVGGLYILSNVESWENLIAAAAAMGIVLIAIAKCFSVLNSSETPDIDHIMEFILGVLGVAAIAAILRITSDISWDTLLASAGAISAVLIAIAGTFKIMNSVEDVKWESVLAFIGGCLAAAVIGLVLTMSNGIDWQSMLGMAGAISAVLIAMGIAFAIMNKTTFTPATAGAMLAGCVAISAIGSALAKAASQDWKNLLSASISISILLLALSLSMMILAGLGGAVEGALIGLLVLDLYIADIVAVLWALSEIVDMDVIKNGGEKLAAIGYALGSFVGSIINAIGVGVGKAIEAIGQSLSNFMENAKPFFDGLSDMDDSKVKAAGALAAVVLALSAAEFLSGITNLLKIFTGDNDMSSFGDKLISFGEAMKKFDESTTGVNAEHVKTVSEAAVALINMAKQIPNTGGWLAAIVGDNDIAAFGEALAKFAPYLRDFDKDTKSITDVSNWQTIADGTLILINMAKQIPNTGGWLAAVVGDNDIAEFGKALFKYSCYMTEFNTKVQGIKDVENWKNLAVGTAYLIGMAKQIPNTGGLVSMITGDNDIGQFGMSLNTYAYWMRSFSIYLKDVDGAKMINIATGTNSLINMCKNVKDIDNKSISNFAVSLSNMAKDGLSKFIEVFSKDTPLAVSAIINALSTLKNIVVLDYSVQNAFTQLAQRSIEQYTIKMNNGTVTAASIVKTFMDKLISVVESLNIKWQLAGVQHAKLYLDSIKAYYDVASLTGKMFSNNLVIGILTTTKNYTSASEGLADVFIKGFKKDATENSRIATIEIIDTIIKIFNNAKDTFKKLGENIGNGISEGIKDKIDDVADEARDMAKKVRESIEDELDIESPSKVMRQDGEYVGEGFALGIIDKLNRVKQASIEMAKSPIDAIGDAIEEIPELDPTITPIIDLTNVMDAADIINKMFNGAISNVGINVNRASNSMNRNQQTNGQQNIQNGDGSGNTNVTFIQNNNSPKELSRIDIYRQTRNQLAQFKEAMQTT